MVELKTKDAGGARMPSVYELARAKMAADAEKMIGMATTPQVSAMKRTGLKTKEWTGKKKKDLTPEQIEARRAYWREWYKLNADRIRDRQRINAEKYRQSHKPLINEKRRIRYNTDPVFRQKRLEDQARQRARRKALREAQKSEVQ